MTEDERTDDWKYDVSVKVIVVGDLSMDMDEILKSVLDKSLIESVPMTVSSSRLVNMTWYEDIELILDFNVGTQISKFISSAVVDVVVLEVMDCVDIEDCDGY